jgi:hypothetical protein
MPRSGLQQTVPGAHVAGPHCPIFSSAHQRRPAELKAPGAELILRPDSRRRIVALEPVAHEIAGLAAARVVAAVLLATGAEELLLLDHALLVPQLVGQLDRQPGDEPLRSERKNDDDADGHLDVHVTGLLACRTPTFLVARSIGHHPGLQAPATPRALDAGGGLASPASRRRGETRQRRPGTTGAPARSSLLSDDRRVSASTPR